MKILLAVDGSAFSVKAAEYLAAHLDLFKGEKELHLLHVKLPIPPGRARAVIGKEEVEQYYEEESRTALAPAEEVLRQHNIAFKAAFRVGEVDDEICAYAQANGIDLVAMGSHGHGALKNLVMGSVATKVLASTSVPVLIIR